uniref:Putative glycosyltransferase n=1 Tax=viral metagenome TaxID=1070528 RepID=A0A6M3MIQ9_9ZZZZ
MNIGLFYDMPGKINGCWKVINNLQKGLRLLGHDVIDNKICPYTGCLQGGKILSRDFPSNTLIGPEIVVLPDGAKEFFRIYKNWVQPAEWVKSYMQQFECTKDTNIHVWPVGIDTELFPARDETDAFIYDCFIYYKNVTKQTPIEKLKRLEDELTRRGMKYKILTYGQYKQEELQQAVKDCVFGILLTGTESQGIGYMEMLSANVPLYVIDEKTFLYGTYTFTSDEVSSAPYFDERCGIKCTDMSRFDEFIDSLYDYEPRQYILDNHTLEKGAKKYVEILKDIEVSGY